MRLRGGGLLGYHFIKHGGNYESGNGEGVERICKNGLRVGACISLVEKIELISGCLSIPLKISGLWPYLISISDRHASNHLKF